jgi:hypothetical protein
VTETAVQNPAWLKLDLYCKGMRLDDSCFVEEDGGRKILRTRAGLGSGLELILPGGLWTNVPVTEAFASQSPYTLHRTDGQYLIRRDGQDVARVKLSPRPRWYEEKTSTGKPMTRVGTLQGTYLGIYQAKVCEYWTAKPVKTNCKFCSVGLNLGIDDADEKSVDEVMEVIRAARRDSHITYVDFNTGHYDGDTYLDILEPYIRRIKAETGLLVGVQTPPHRDLKRYDRLRAMGVNRVSFCFEIFDRKLFEEICPGKHAEYGLDHYLEAVRYCATLGSKGPRTEEMVPVFRRLYEACMEAGLPVGCAPNVHVSLVMLPEECRGLSPRRYPLRSLRLGAMKTIFARRFASRLARLEGPPAAAGRPQSGAAA